MANLVIIVDPDPQRRRRYAEVAARGLEPTPGLVADGCELGPFCARWAARPGVVSSRSEAPCAALFGYARARASREPVDADRIAGAWTGDGDAPEQFDGFYGAFRFEPESGLLVGGDVLGLFPIFYAHDAGSGVLLAGTSPELFRLHPDFPLRLDPEGLAGLMLADGIFEGRTLLAGVRRLAPGHALHQAPGRAPREVLCYRTRFDETIARLGFDEQVAALDEALHGAVRAHLAEQDECGILLTGGRDSRLLAGVAGELSVRAHALTLGRERDFEVTCAARVAAALGFTHRSLDPSIASVVDGAEAQARWTHMTAGFVSVHFWAAIEALQALPPMTLAGHLLDSVVARMYVQRNEFPPANRRILEAPARERLFRRSGLEAAHEAVLDRMRVAFRGAGATDERRWWRFWLAHTERSYAGGVPWLLGFGSWPVLPVLDARLLEVALSIPYDRLAERRAQDAILLRRFPRLASLRLVRRNADTVSGVGSSRWTRARDRFVDRVPLAHRHRWLLEGGRDRRFNDRIYDLDGPAWREIRARAEPGRDRLATWLDPDALREVIPEPDVRMDLEYPYLQGYNRKFLIGLMLWSVDHVT